MPVLFFTSCFIIPTAIVGISTLVVVYTYNCADISHLSSVYPGDTVLAASLQCQHDARLTQTLSPRAIVDVYATDCHNLTFHTKPESYSYPPYSDIDFAVPILEQGKPGDSSNYYLENTSIEIDVRISSMNNSEVYLCLFNNVSTFQTFKKYRDEHLLNILMLAVTCDKIQVEANVSSFHHMPLKINVTNYYFVGLSSPKQRLDSLQYNISLTRNFYNYSDFEQDYVDCHLARINSTCSISNNHSSTCILLHATFSGALDFNFVSVSAAKEPIQHTSRFVITLSSSSSFSGAIILIVITVTIIYKVYCNKRPHTYYIKL